MHGHSEESIRHILRPDRCADNIVYEEAGETADNSTDEETVFLLVEKTCEAEDRKSDDIVAKHRLPAPGISAVQEKLEQTVDKARQHAGTEAPAGAVEKDRQHGDSDGTALGQFKKLEIADDLGKRDKDGPFSQSAKCDSGLLHVFFLPINLKSGKENIRFLNEPDINELALSYAGIIRIRFRGVEALLLHLSREKTQRPLKIVKILYSFFQLLSSRKESETGSRRPKQGSRSGIRA